MKTHAIDLAKKGFHIFPLIPNSKKPLISDFRNQATRDLEKIEKWWKDNPDANIGISTSAYAAEGALLAVDIDVKEGKDGYETVNKLEIQEGKLFPSTFSQRTPSGGEHLIYVVPEPVKQGTDVLGRGIDVRSSGGYVVGSGSVIDGGVYRCDNSDLAEAPQWVVASCGLSKEKPQAVKVPSAKIDPVRAKKRAMDYLVAEAPLAVQGEGGDQTTFKVATRVKDFGVSQAICLEVMWNYWNRRCTPPWSPADLKAKVGNAYTYGHRDVGSSAPEMQFDSVIGKAAVPVDEEKLHPFDEINKEYAFVTLGGSSAILHETLDHEGNPTVNFLTEHAFHRKLLADTIVIGDRPKQLSELWMKSKQRRSYDGVCFDPSTVEKSGRYFNTWRGMAVEPSKHGSQRAKDSLKVFLEHVHENICGSDEELAHWQLQFFAHMVQKPREKPTVALVYKGKKGVGKNAAIDRVGRLFGSHYILTSDKRYLVGNFNSHLQDKILITLDEAFWSGDKAAEGALKNLISGNNHVIEQKGKESFQSKNCARVCIIGNEEWLVPASDDERRYAVFNVGEKRRQNTAYFREMREGMEDGGYPLLLDYLLNYDITNFDVSVAPMTEGLLEQKIESLDPFDKWWFECLKDGRIVAGDFDQGWPTGPVSRDRFRQALQRYAKDHGMPQYGIGTAIAVGRSLKKCVPTYYSLRPDNIWSYIFPSLAHCREEWDKRMGQKTEWPD